MCWPRPGPIHVHKGVLFFCNSAFIRVTNNCIVCTKPYAIFDLKMAFFKPVTLGDLISKDLKEAFILPIFPLPADGQYDNVPFINNEQYKVYDYPPPDPTYNAYQFAWKVACTAGNKFAVLVDRLPYPELQEHWKQWLPVFPPASYKSISDGLAGTTPLVTVAALQSVRDTKYSVHPDIIYELNHKSAILKIGVPCPKHMTPENISFPCVVKVDMAWGGRGNILVKNHAEFSDALERVRRRAGWKGGLVIQEYLENIINVHECNFYLFKSGEIHWLGVYSSQFDFSDGNFELLSGFSDFEKYLERKEYVYDKFIVPIAKFLHEKGYFGAICCEIVENEKGMFLVDLNVRISGATSHFLVLPYMAHLGFTKSRFLVNKKFSGSTPAMIHQANLINKSTDKGRIIIFILNDCDGNNNLPKCNMTLSIYGRSYADVEELTQRLEEV